MTKVSVIIPAYNASKYIREALDSVFRQTYLDFEVVVVDDGSTDETVEILKTYGNRVRWMTQEHQGQAYALNRAIGMATGEYFAYFDADDIMLPTKLKVQVRYLDEHPDVDFVYSDSYYSDKKGITVKKSQHYDPFYLLQYCYILRITVMHRRKCLEGVNLFNGLLTGSDDWDMWVRMSEYCKMVYIDQALSIYRIHGGNISFVRPKRLNHYRRVRMVIVNDACERRGRPTWLRIMTLSAKMFWLVGRLPVLGECSPRLWLSVASRIQRGAERLLLGWMATSNNQPKKV